MSEDFKSIMVVSGYLLSCLLVLAVIFLWIINNNDDNEPPYGLS